MLLIGKPNYMKTKSKDKKAKKGQEIRIPRPWSLTQMMVLYNQLDDGPERADLKAKMDNVVIMYWSMNNGDVFGIPMSVAELSRYAHIPMETINLSIQKRLTGTSILTEENTQEISRALLNLGIQSMIEDRNDINYQVNILRNAQGGEYKPFISAEVNKALKLKLDSTSQIANMLKSTTGNGGIVINNNNEPKYGDEVTINIDEVNQTINEQIAVLFNDDKKRIEMAKGLYETHGLAGMPNVNAIEQTDMDVEREGLDSAARAVELRLATDSYGTHTEEDKENKRSKRKQKHQDRRANQIGLDIENDAEFDAIIEADN